MNNVEETSQLTKLFRGLYEVVPRALVYGVVALG